MSELKKAVFLLKNAALRKENKYKVIIAVLLVILALTIFYLVTTDEGYYHQTIAKITAITATVDAKGSAEQDINQKITAVIMNGSHKGEKIQLQNSASYSQTVNSVLQVNDEVFIRLQQDAHKGIVGAQILNVKRDKYITYITIVFALLIVLVGGLKGFKSLASVMINVAIVTIVIKLYLQGYNLILIASLASVLFIVISISLVSGINKKSFSAIVGTIVGTLMAMLITAAVFFVTHGHGIHYEEMEFLTGPPEKVFIAEILVGTLGAIMDIAISISSSIQEMYDQNPAIEKKVLLSSGREIGKDIMGTMANTLVFAYISGSIPMILLWLVNGFSIFYIINVNISLEIIRALTGSIGIVLSIPITMYIAVLLLKRNRIGELKKL